MSDNTISLIINSIVALAGVGLGYWLNNRASKKALDLVSLQEFLKAAAEFKTAFTEEIISLKKPPTTSYEDTAQMILRKAAAKHNNAMILFRPHIAESSQSLFDKAWEEYDGADKYSGSDQDAKKAKRKLALERIEKLLEYAK